MSYSWLSMSTQPAVDAYREQVEEALKAGASKADVARALGVAPSTLQAALQRWGRPERPKPGVEALQALRDLVEE